MRSRTGRACVWLCVVALAVTGCAGYRVGPSSGQSAGARSVMVGAFENKTIQPRLGEYVINSLRKSLQRDGTYRLDTHDEGDIIMSGVITSYQRAELSVQPTDVTTAQDYEVTMTAQIKAQERATGRIILDKPVRGRTTLRVGADLTSAERQAIPLLADDLARKATAMLVDGSW